MIVAAAALFASCGDNDLFKDINNQNQAETGSNAITFTPGSEKVTKGSNAAENSEALYTWTFYQHQSDFEVWGYKIVDPTIAVFGSDTTGTIVTVKDTLGTYVYSYANDTVPLRFWDKTSQNYQFYAASPAGADWTFTYTGAVDDPATYGTGTFSTKAVLYGVNLQSVVNGGITDALKNTFKNATLVDTTKKDIDKMIAAPCQVNQPSYNKPNPDAVHLNFIHILSKLNVTIKTDLDSLYEVKLLQFEVKNMPGKGDFNEAAAVADHTKKNSRWDVTNYTYNDKIDYLTGLEDTNAVIVSNAKQYIVESLVVPQDVNYERVALDGKKHDEVDDAAVLFADYEEYAKSNPIEALTKEEFDSIRAITNLSAEDSAKITKTPATHVDEYIAVDNSDVHSSEPYFMIKYTINGEPFTAYYNLVAAFNGLTNNETIADLGTDKKKLGFYEGWQNTLNINIHPTEIEFTADIADWSTVESADFKIEKGNY